MPDNVKAKLGSLLKNYDDRLKAEEVAAKARDDEAHKGERTCEAQLATVVRPALAEMVAELTKQGRMAEITEPHRKPVATTVVLSFTPRPRQGPSSSLLFWCGGGNIATSLHVNALGGSSERGGGSVAMGEVSRDWVQAQVVGFIEEVLKVS